MLRIRLARIGAKSRPSYRIIVSEGTKDTYGTYLEQVGTYDPMSTPKVFNCNADRIKYWISCGAQPSATLHNLLVTNGVITAKKVAAFKARPKKEDEKK